MDIKLEEKVISGLLASGKQFVIPRFQREYTWEKYNNREFFNDILGYMVTKDGKLYTKQYFLGTMLFVGDFADSKCLEMNVVDGQQRITTITIFLSALSDKFRSLGTSGETLSIQLFKKYIMTLDDDGEEVRVLKSESHYPFFSFYIQDRKKEEIQPPSTEEEECIKTSYEFFSKQLEEKNLRKYLSQKYDKKIVDTTDYIDLLKIIRDQILGCNIVSISTTEKEEANTIFEILNSKGKHLSDIDMIKNKIFEVLCDTEPADFAQVKWNEIKRVLSSSDNVVGLKSFYLQYWATFKKRVTSRKLYDEFKTIKEDKSVYKEFLKDLLIKAELYEMIVNPTREKYSNKKQYFPLIESLSAINDTFNVVSARVPILAMYTAVKEKRLTEKKYKATVKYLENFHFVYTAMCSKPANKLDPLYSKFALEMKNAAKDTTSSIIDKELIKKLDCIWPEYQSFEEEFIQLKYSGKKVLPTNLKVKYIMNQLRNYYDGKDVSAQDGSVEHIYPESKGCESQNIGNLILLESSLNSSAGEAEYEIKKTDYYVKSDYKWVQDFIIEHESWSIEEANERALNMAKLYYTKVLGRRIKEDTRISKSLVAYFSATGTTGVVATKLAKALGADIYEIVPEVPYTNADLNWKDESSRSSTEMQDKSSRPAIGSDPVEDIGQYDTIFIGAPVWWYVMPHILNTFLEQYDLTGKKVVIFATSGGSTSLGKSAEELAPSAPGAEVINGDILNGDKSDDELRAFAEKYI